MTIHRSSILARTPLFVLVTISSVLAVACRSADSSSAVEVESRPVVRIADSQRSRADFAGKWETTYGTMTLARFGERLSGTYDFDGEASTIQGKQVGNRFTFTYAEPEANGEGWFELAADGTTFRGEWRSEGAESWEAWEGKRAGAEPVEELGFAGVWSTTYGVMRLTQKGTHVQGTYTFGDGSTIEGEVEGRTLRSVYEEPNGTKGRAVFELSEDGSQIHGVWRPDSEAPLAMKDEDAQAWNGQRVKPVPGRVWLVILEAHWEGSLAEQEFSYGAMLRAFFERLPNVEVRHRFFHDKADFERFCAELDALVEPVVLYVSSHGVPDGVLAGNDLIDGTTIGNALRGLDTIQLLHLGGCATLGGDLGSEIRAALEPGTAFPISGFKVPVDWSGSAIVDFTYLDLVLERGMAPAEAVQSVRSMIRFAGEPTGSDDPIAGTDLSVSEPAL